MSRLEDVFHRAAELSGDERVQFLDRECDGDPKLRQRVEALLRQDGSDAGGFPVAIPGSRRRTPEPERGSPPSAPASFRGDPPNAHVGRSIPERLGPYHIRRILGKGSMGVVYEALDESLDRSVAVKTLPSDLAADPSRLRRFLREATMLASINHPNVATIHFRGEERDVHYLVMELIEGGTLDDRLRRAPVPVEEALEIGRQIARALEATHARGVMHRDLKPRNVLFTTDGTVKVCDFGLAKGYLEMGAPGGSRDTTLPGMILGTFGYMSPEQLRGKSDLDDRADIWAFGCILFECLTGVPAFPGESPIDVMTATMGGEPDWNRLPAETPGACRELLERCLEKSVERRMSRIAEARHWLDEYAADQRHRPLRSEGIELEADVPNNLPIQVARFIGREQESREVQALLEANVLVSLAGAGGRGKTRLALEVAARSLERFSDGVWVVELASLSDGALLDQTVAATLGLRGERDQEWTELIEQRLAGRSTLLVLDNCEHLLPECASLAHRLLRSCSGLAILCTTRERLGVPGETLYAVPSLDLPDAADADGDADLEALSRVESIALFLDRARAVRHDFQLDARNATAVTAICRRLDGIPLAIELAAARVRMLTPAEIRDRLDRQLQFLVGGSRTGLPHHRTLRALVDWSYDYLEEAEKALFQRLSVFAGGWTLEAAERVCTDDRLADWEVLDVLTRLVDRSMVEVDAEAGRRTGRARYRLLDTMRAYAAERILDRPEERDRVSRAHLDFYLEMAETAEPELTGARAETWLRTLDVEHDNLRQALAREPQGDAEAELRLRLARALWMFWYQKGYWTDARTVLRRLLADSDQRPKTLALARALIRAAGIAFLQGDYDESENLSNQSLALSRELTDPDSEARSLEWLGAVAEARGDHESATRLMEQSIEIKRRIGDDAGLVVSYNDMGAIALKRGESARARRLHEEALEIARRTGNRTGEAVALSRLGAVSLWEGRYDEARRLEEESLALQPEMGDQSSKAKALRKLGAASFHQGDLPAARTFYERGLEIDRRLGNPWNQAVSLAGLGWVLAAQGDLETADGVLRESVRLLAEIGNRETMGEALDGLAYLAHLRGDRIRAAGLLAAAEALRVRHDVRSSPAAQRQRAGLHEQVRKAAGAEFDSAWQGARALSWNEIVRRALAH